MDGLDDLTLGPVALRDPQGRVTYHWYFNDEPLERETGVNLHICRADLEEYGAYFVRLDDGERVNLVAI